MLNEEWKVAHIGTLAASSFLMILYRSFLAMMSIIDQHISLISLISPRFKFVPTKSDYSGAVDIQIPLAHGRSHLNRGHYLMAGYRYSQSYLVPAATCDNLHGKGAQ